MHTMLFLLSLLLFTSGTGTTDLPSPDTTQKNTITIEQFSPAGSPGSWTLITPVNDNVTGNEKKRIVSSAREGSYTLIVTPPKGAKAKIWVYNGTTILQNVERPQVSFSLVAGESRTVNIHYIFTRVGTVVVSSDPPGLTFTLKGPNATAFSGTTPTSFPQMPEGQYSTIFSSLSGCVTPPMKSLFLEKGLRITFSVKLVCEEAERRRQVAVEEEEHAVTVITSGKAITFADVPQESWFAPFVFTVAKLGIMAGYTDAKGNPTGEFGPGNVVTLAELAAIAHRLGGITPLPDQGAPKNPRARNAWFSPFITSAEDRGWPVFLPHRPDPLRPATRGEVVITLLHILDIPLQWPKGKNFTDVTVTTPYASAIETAATEHLIVGHTDPTGKPLGTFGPEERVNRAEVAKMITAALERLEKTAASSALRAP